MPLDLEIRRIQLEGFKAIKDQQPVIGGVMLMRNVALFEETPEETIADMDEVQTQGLIDETTHDGIMIAASRLQFGLGGSYLS